MITAASNSDTDPRSKVRAHLDDKRYSRVIDVGGAGNIWAAPWVTDCLDINAIDPRDTHNAGVTSHVGDICSLDGWVIGSTQAVNVFDFSICSQTLEDLRNPQLTLKMLPLISKRGYIEIPNKITELRKDLENCAPADQEVCGFDLPYCGYMHHRWIFSYDAETLWLFPKLNFVDRIIALTEWANEQEWKSTSLSIWWEDTLPFQTWNDDYLGPNAVVIIKGYRENLVKGI